jgi:hypothetical protein
MYKIHTECGAIQVRIILQTFWLQIIRIVALIKYVIVFIN